MPTVHLSNVELFYQELGQGRDLVLVHGLAANHASWPLKILLTCARRYRVITFDLRGHGRSGMPSSGYTCQKMAEDLAELLTVLKVHDGFLLGHSFGGLLALQYLAREPHRVAKAVIVDVRHRGFQPSVPLEQWPSDGQLKQELINMGAKRPPDSTEPGLWVLEHLARLSKDNRVEHHTERESFLPFGGRNGARKSAEHWIRLLETTTLKTDLLTDQPFDPSELRGLSIPLFALYGQKSPLLPTLDRLREIIPHMAWKIVPNAGHFLPWTHTEVFLETVLTFLESGSEPDRIQ